MLTNKEVSTESLPSWFTNAQQQAVSAISNVQAPAVADTAAQSAINAFQPGTSPFGSAQSTLESIGSGAANPWLASGQPNTATPMGGLFAAQTEQAKQFMPEIDTAQTARNIAGGDFGSAMNLGGVSRARSNFLTDLYQKQMQSALQNQQTGVAAGSALGNVGNQLVQSALNTGTFQQNAPYASALNLANVVGKLQAPKTTTKSMDLGFLNQLGALGSMVTGGINALSGDYVMDPKTGKVSKRPGILDQIGIKGGLPGLYNKVTGLFSGSSGDAPSVNADAGAYNENTGMMDYIGADGNQVSIDASGNYYDEAGNMIWSPGWGTSTDESYEEDNMNGGDSGGYDDNSGGYYDDYTGDFVPYSDESNNDSDSYDYSNYYDY
jgi:hypothetical protein